MKDRQPLRPNRVLITPEDGSPPFHATIERADEPVEEGHRLNKHTLLKDATCGMLGLDPAESVPDDALQMLAALASSGGSGSGDVGELEDTEMEIGSIVNAGAGWNTYKFRAPFEAPPHVVLQPVNFDGLVQIRSITAEGFLYCVRQAGVGDGEVTTDRLYTGAGTGTSTQHSAHTVVTGVTLPAVSMGTTEEPVAVNYIAIEYGGDR